MKKFISVLLAVLMVFSTTVMAAPATVSTVETAQEEAALDYAGLGELESVVTVKPGINMLTGTTEPLTGENTTDAHLASIAKVSSSTTNTFTVSDDPKGVNGKVLKWHVPNDCTSRYPTLTFEYGGVLQTLAGHDAIHFSFDVAKVVDLDNMGEDGVYEENENFWIMNHSTSGTDVVKSVQAKHNVSWKNYNSLHHMTSGTTHHKQPTNFKLEADILLENTVDTLILLDNFYAVPAYEFKFYSPDGKTLIDTRYQAFGDDGKIITSYKPEAGIYGDYYISGWSTTMGASAVGEIALANENLTFYATSMEKALSLELDGNLGGEGETATLIPVVVPSAKDAVDVTRTVWEISDETVAAISKNKNGTATLTAVGEGKATVTCRIGTASAQYEVTVAYPIDADITGIDGTDGVKVSMDTGNYSAMLVTLDNTTVGSTYKLNYAIDGGDEYSVDIVATSTSSRDYYVDLTSLEGWTDGSEVTLKLEANGASVKSVKFYSYFDAGFELVISADSTYLTSPSEETDITVGFVSQLEGAYDEGYTLTVTDESGVASYKVYEDGTAKVRAGVGNGVVTVTATSKEDESYSVSKDIYVNVDSTKYGHYHDFLGDTALDSAEVKAITDSNTGVGNTTAALVNDMVHLDRPTTASGTGGLAVYGTSSGNQKYIVVKTADKVDYIRVYYHYDSTVTNETNVAVASGVKNADGTYSYTVDCANVPEDAELMKHFIIQIPKESTADVICMYTTSIAPEEEVDKKIAYTWDMKNTTFGASQCQGLAVFNGETMWSTQSYAVIDGNTVGVQTKAETLADGTEIYRLSTTNGTHGSLTPKSYPSGIKLSDYPYFWFTYRSNGTNSSSLYLKDKDAGGEESGWNSNDVVFEKSDEFVRKVVYLPDVGFDAALNDTFTSMMFPFRGRTVLTNVQQDATGYYVPKDYTYSSQTWIEFDEITIANYNPDEEYSAPLDIAIVLEPSATEITEDGGSITVSANVFANKEISTKDVIWSISGGTASFAQNEDGSITVKAVSNGEATITASSLEDTSFSTSMTITVSGQRNKIAAYDFKYLAVGNSYCLHGGTSQFQVWCGTNDIARGMAASEPDLDYYHRVQYYLTDGFNATLTAERIAGSGLENSSENETTIEAATAKIEANSDFVRIREYLRTEQPNVITLQLSENFGGKGEIERNFYDVFYGMVDRYRPAKSVVVCITPFGAGTRVDVIKEFAAKYGFYVADMTFVSGHSVVDLTNRYFVKNGKTYDRGENGWKYNPYLAWEQYPEYDEWLADGRAETEFRTHPGDKGMDAIGQKVFEQFKSAIPSFLDAEYVFIPDTLEIAGADTITEAGGSINLSAVVTPDDSSADVIWSVDNEKYATISSDGVLTAKVNGTVTVTATCAYDAELAATKIVTISGQPDVFTVTYNAGTAENVTELPAADAYARGEYALSKLVPSRNGYKFLGWSLTEGGETVKSITVDKDTTVYAVWTLAESWHFDENDNLEGITFGGFNVVVKNGIGTVLPYEDGVIISDSTLLLDSENFDGFNVRMDLSGTDEADLTLTLEITSTEGMYFYTEEIPVVGEQVVYTYDISAVKGTITGFALKPSAKNATANVDWIEFERTSLSDGVDLDKVNVVDDYTVNANGNTYTLRSLTVHEGATLTLENGTFVIVEYSGEGELVSNGNVLYEKDGIDGYVQFAVGEKENLGAIRYAEVDGYQYVLNNDCYGLILDEGETKLVEVVEKLDEDDVTTTCSKYYKVNADGAEEITALNDSIDNVDELEIRVKDPVGVRFKAGILTSVKNDAVVSEYGFVIALEKDLVNENKQLTLDFYKIATGTAYSRQSGTDIIFSTDSTTTFFTGVLYGIPEDSYGVRLVSRTYTKLAIDGNEYVVYGEPVTASAYEIAKAMDTTDLGEEAKAVIENIIDKSENGNEVGFDYGDL